MRVALIVERFEAAGGGGEHAVWNIARELVKTGDQVHVLCRRGVDAPGLTLVRLATPSFWQPLRVLAFNRNVHRALGGNSFDVVHSFSRTLDHDIFNVGGGCHASYMENTYGSLGVALRQLSPRHRTLLSLERRIFANPKVIAHCVSKKVQREIAARYRVPTARLPVLYCGVDTQRFAPERHADDREAMRSEFAVRDATLWLFAGSGWRRKGLDLALKALAEVNDSDTLLWVAGKDDPRIWRVLATRLGIQKRVHFLGERNDLDRCYAAADGLLLPTRYDAFGLVCLEAAAAGLPVMMSSNAGACELFESCGQVVKDSENPRAYAHLMNALAQAEPRAKLGAKALTMARKHDWSQHVAELRTLYRRVLQSKNKRRGHDGADRGSDPTDMTSL